MIISSFFSEENVKKKKIIISWTERGKNSNGEKKKQKRTAGWNEKCNWLITKARKYISDLILKHHNLYIVLLVERK